MRLMGAMTWHAYVQLNPCPRVESKMPDYLEKYQRKIKEDDKKDDKPIQGMINTIIRILNYVATFLQLVYSIFLSVIHILKPTHVLFKLNPWTYEGDRGGCQPLF